MLSLIEGVRQPFEVVESTLVTSEARDACARLDTIHWVSNLAMMSATRYREILRDPAIFSTVFPGVNPDNPTINHVIDGYGVAMTTTKREILSDHNFDLFKGHQIVLAIVGMTGVVEAYLTGSATKFGCERLPRESIMAYFERATGVRLREFDEWARLSEFVNVRHISVHNLGRMDRRFRERTQRAEAGDGPYVYFPHNPREYRDIAARLLFFIERQIARQ